LKDFKKFVDSTNSPTLDEKEYLKIKCDFVTAYWNDYINYLSVWNVSRNKSEIEDPTNIEDVSVHIFDIFAQILKFLNHLYRIDIGETIPDSEKTYVSEYLKVNNISDINNYLTPYYAELNYCYAYDDIKVSDEFILDYAMYIFQSCTDDMKLTVTDPDELYSQILKEITNLYNQLYPLSDDIIVGFYNNYWGEYTYNSFLRYVSPLTLYETLSTFGLADGSKSNSDVNKLKPCIVYDIKKTSFVPIMYNSSYSSIDWMNKKVIQSKLAELGDPDYSMLYFNHPCILVPSSDGKGNSYIWWVDQTTDDFKAIVTAANPCYLRRSCERNSSS
jgi:hypothetical protein